MADEAASSRIPLSRDADPVFLMHLGGKIDSRPTVDVPDPAALAMAYTRASRAFAAPSPMSPSSQASTPGRATPSRS